VNNLPKLDIKQHAIWNQTCNPQHCFVCVTSRLTNVTTRSSKYRLSITLPPTGERSIVMTMSVCLSVCLSASIPPELHVRSFVHATYVRGSVLLWRRLRYVMYFRLYRWRHVCIYIYWPGLGDAILTQQGMAWIYQRGVYSRWFARGNTGWGVESDIYDCLVLRSSGW